MNDFIGGKQCVTHHNACDCREALIAETISRLTDDVTDLRKICEAHKRRYEKAEGENKRLRKYCDDTLPFLDSHDWEKDWGLEVAVEMEEWINEMKHFLNETND